MGPPLPSPSADGALAVLGSMPGVKDVQPDQAGVQILVIHPVLRFVIGSRYIERAAPPSMSATIRSAIAFVASALVAAPSSAAAQEDEPTKWEQLFFPFPIVGAPPQLEQQVQVFNSYFHGNAGSGDVPSAELAYIATPHLGPRRDRPLPDRVRWADDRVRGRSAPRAVAGRRLARARQHALGRGDGDVPDGSRRLEQRRLLRRALRLRGAALLPSPDLRGQRDDAAAGRARGLDAADPRDGARLRAPHPAALLVSRSTRRWRRTARRTLAEPRRYHPGRPEARPRRCSSRRRCSSGPSRARSATALASRRASPSTSWAIRSTPRRTRSPRRSTSRTPTDTELKVDPRVRV